VIPRASFVQLEHIKIWKLPIVMRRKKMEQMTITANFVRLASVIPMAPIRVIIVRLANIKNKMLHFQCVVRFVSLD
jgi:hypothetical protein